MPLRGPRFSGDPALEACLLGQHRMLAPEQGLAVMRVQAALIELGHSVGAAGSDGVFGSGTGNAVSAYKAEKQLVPSDPVVGPGTAKALDDDLFFDPPDLDPLFAEFSPATVAHRLDPFIAQELAGLIGAPLDSWRHMLGRFALARLGSEDLLGIVAQSRREDLRARYMAVAAPEQPNGMSASEWFDDQTPVGLVANTVVFSLPDDSTRTFIVIKDNVILGHEVITRTSTGETAPVTLLGVLVHELTHVRNRDDEDALRGIPDDDADTFVDTALAQARSATGRPTGGVLRSFAAEMCARHVHWVIVKEVAGTPGPLTAPAPEALAAAVILYFVEFTGIFDTNGYAAGINAQGGLLRIRQIELWLRRCQAFSFSDDDAENARTQALFGGAAAACATLASDPSLDVADADGLFPLPGDFR